jgi:hypothetical protein
MTNFSYSRHKAFGWVVHQKRLAAGETYKARVPATTPQNLSGNITLWTMGRITGVRAEDGFVTPERTPGYYSEDRQEIPAGTYEYTAQEDSEWWCFNWVANRHSLPKVQPLRFAQGQSAEFPVGAKLLLCRGALAFGGSQVGHVQAIKIESGTTVITATQDSYGFIIEEERE